MVDVLVVVQHVKVQQKILHELVQEVVIHIVQTVVIFDVQEVVLDIVLLNARRLVPVDVMVVQEDVILDVH